MDPHRAYGMSMGARGWWWPTASRASAHGRGWPLPGLSLLSQTVPDKLAAAWARPDPDGPPPPTPKTATCDRSLGQLSPAPGEPP